MAHSDLRLNKGRILSIRDLPTLPSVLDEVVALVEDPTTSTEQIAKIIAYDQVLSAKVLKMVNSPIYGFPGRIGSIHHALVLLGFNVIRGIVISTSVLEIMAQSMTRLWTHSVRCALAAGCIARRAGLKDPDEYSVAGLLHDLGKLVIALQLPDLQAAIDDKVAQDDTYPLLAEKEMLGFGHDRVNAWLAKHWNLPPSLEEGLSHHHKPHLARNYPKFASVVHLADFIVHVLDGGSEGKDLVPYLEPEALDILGLTTQDFGLIIEDFFAKHSLVPSFSL
ncbi:putative signal transduction protein [Desulfocurvibacter africanus PCS]|uniref:Putative signal transduction protein n=1 Tax=Desulfocurvibacter africanus PCS TaxID=1262666 RepID=M5PXE0_DESAF|nr:HDOD domain-containing protein [Desulfocurvibacter africanus]EMG38724.1 putative signal transduction protein [Desulfocurvibacter africanus PCS]